MKEKFTNALGTFGLVCFWILSFLFIAVPIWAADLPWYATAILYIVMVYTDVLGSLLIIPLYIYSTFIVLSSPMNWLSVVFFIDMALYIVMCLIPFVVAIAQSFEHRDE